jgi:hypothetical protein
VYLGGTGLRSAGPGLAENLVVIEFPRRCGAPPTASAALSRVAPQCIPAARFSVFVLPTAILSGTSGRPGYGRRLGPGVGWYAESPHNTNDERAPVHYSMT